MVVWALLLLILGLAGFGYHLGTRRALASASASAAGLHSLPGYYGYYVAIWCALPALALVGLWLAFEPRIVQWLVVGSLPADVRDLPPERLGLMLSDIRNLARAGIVSREPDAIVAQAAADYLRLLHLSRIAMAVIALALGIAGLTFARQKIVPRLRARNQVEAVMRSFLLLSSMIAILTTIGIVFSLVFEAGRFFLKVPPSQFLFGLEWSPQIALRPGQVGGSGLFGAVPLFAGTLLISAIALSVAMPVGLFSAIYMAEYAHPRVRAVVKPLLEILAGIPTVVYGFFAALTVAPFFRDLGGNIGIPISSESALAAGLVMGVMIIPFVSSLSDDVISAVPRAMREGSYGLGATQSETITRVILPAALPGIVGGFLLAASRAIGETMIVVMAAGLSANLTINPLEAVTTVTVQIATLLVGDQEFDSAKTLSAFALGLVLFFVTLALNVIALHIVKKYREQYE